MISIQSPLKQVPLEELRPTQMTVGYHEVAAKRRDWARLEKSKRSAAMRASFFPAVCGPRKRYYILDHHHEALALAQEHADRVQVGVIKDLSKLSKDSFWAYLDHYRWVHCYDVQGRRRPFDAMPKRFEDMRDDPYRSLAAQVRDGGGYARSDTPYLEFLWANFLRDRIPAARLKADPEAALSKALELARSRAAAHLPGWCKSKP